MAYWWVNHKQTRDHEVRGDYLWSPRRNQNGARNQSYDNMALAQPGDIVYSYANGVLGAVGIVIARASPCPKPTEFGNRRCVLGRDSRCARRDWSAFGPHRLCSDLANAEMLRTQVAGRIGLKQCASAGIGHFNERVGMRSSK